MEGIGVGLAGIDGEAGVAVGGFGDVEAVPVDDGGFSEIIGEVNADDGIFFYTDDGPKIGIGEGGEGVGWAVEELALILPDGGGGVFKKVDGGLGGGEGELYVWFLQGSEGWRNRMGRKGGKGDFGRERERGGGKGGELEKITAGIGRFFHLKAFLFD